MATITARAHRAAALGLLLLGAGTALADEAPMQAGWAPRELRFTYQGFTTKYSCDGLSGRIQEVLLLLGARKQDLKVSTTGCAGGFGRPTPFPGVMVKISVLEPIGEKTAPGPSRWPRSGAMWMSGGLSRSPPPGTAN